MWLDKFQKCMRIYTLLNSSFYIVYLYLGGEKVSGQENRRRTTSIYKETIVLSVSKFQKMLENIILSPIVSVKFEDSSFMKRYIVKCRKWVTLSEAHCYGNSDTEINKIVPLPAGYVQTLVRLNRFFILLKGKWEESQWVTCTIPVSVCDRNL